MQTGRACKTAQAEIAQQFPLSLLKAPEVHAVVYRRDAWSEIVQAMPKDRRVQTFVDLMSGTSEERDLAIDVFLSQRASCRGASTTQSDQLSGIASHGNKNGARHAETLLTALLVRKGVNFEHYWDGTPHYHADSMNTLSVMLASENAAESTVAINSLAAVTEIERFKELSEHGLNRSNAEVLIKLVEKLPDVQRKAIVIRARPDLMDEVIAARGITANQKEYHALVSLLLHRERDDQGVAPSDL